MISSLGGASPTAPAFSLLDPNNPTVPPPPSGILFKSSGAQVSEGNVYGDGPTPTTNPGYSTSGLKQSLGLYASSASLISVDLENALGEADGTAVLGYVTSGQVQASTQVGNGLEQSDVYDSRGNVLGTFDLSSSNEYQIMDSQGTFDATAYLESEGISSSQIAAAAAAQTQAGAGWTGSTDIKSIEAALAQYILLQSEISHPVTTTTDVYNAQGNYVASFGEQWSRTAPGSFEEFDASGNAYSLTNTIANAGGGSAAQQAADVAQETQTTSGLIDSVASDVNEIGTLILDQHTAQPSDALYDSSGNLLNLQTTSISAVYDASGNYAGSTGIDPATGEPATWDTWGQISLNALPTSAISTWTQTQIQALSVSDIRNLTPSQIGQFNSNQIGWLNSVQTSVLTAPQVAGISSTAIGALSVQALAPAALGGISASEINLISTSRISNLTATQVSNLTPTAIGAMDLSHLTAIYNVDQMTAAQTAAIGLDKISSLTQHFLNNVDAVGLSGFSPQAFGELSSSQVGFLYNGEDITAAQLGAIQPSAISALTNYVMFDLSPSANAGFTPAQIAQLSGYQISWMHDYSQWSAAQIGAITPNAIAGMDTGDVSSISTTGVSGLTSAQINNLSGGQIAALSSSQIAAISPATFGSLDATHFALLLSSGAVTGPQAGAISPSSISGLSAQQFGDLKDLSSFSAAQIAAISPEIISGLSNQQLGSLNATQFAELSSAQVSALSQSQLTGLGPGDLPGIFRFNQTGNAPVNPLYSFSSYSSNGSNAIGLNGHAASAWNGSSWVQLSGSFSKVLVAADQSIWGITTTGDVERLISGQWQSTNQSASDIASDVVGNIYITDGSVKSFSQGTFTDIYANQTGFTNLALGANGQVFALKADDSIWQTYVGDDPSWTEVSGGATQLSGQGNGLVFALGTDSQVYQWSNSAWVATGQLGSSIGASSNGDVSVVDNHGLLIPDLIDARNSPVAALPFAASTFSTNGTIAVAVSTSGQTALWNGNAWTTLSGNFSSAIVAGDGTIWATNFDETMQYVDGSWAYRGGGLLSLASDSTGQVYGTQTGPFGGDVVKYGGGVGWQDLGGGQVEQVAVGANGNLYGLTSNGIITYNPAANTNDWSSISIPALASVGISNIAASSGDGSLYLSSDDDGGKLYNYNFQTGEIQSIGAGDIHSISASAAGQLSTVDSNGFVTPDVAGAQSIAIGPLAGLSQLSANGTTAVALGSGSQANTAFFWNGEIWQQLSGSFSKVIQSGSGQIWAINTAGEVQELFNGTWFDKGVSATDITSDANGNIFIANGSNNIERYSGGFDPYASGTSWNNVGDSAAGISLIKVAVGMNDQVFAVGSDGSVWGQYDGSWSQFADPGSATDIAADENYGLYVLAANSHVFKYDVDGLIDTNLTATSISTSPNSGLLLVNANGSTDAELYRDNVDIAGVYDTLSSRTGTVTVADSAASPSPNLIFTFVQHGALTPVAVPGSEPPGDGGTAGLNISPDGLSAQSAPVTSTVNGEAISTVYSFASNPNDPDDFQLTGTTSHNEATGQNTQTTFSSSGSTSIVTNPDNTLAQETVDQGGQTLTVNPSYSLNPSTPLGNTETQNFTLTDDATGKALASGSIVIPPVSVPGLSNVPTVLTVLGQAAWLKTGAEVAFGAATGISGGQVALAAAGLSAIIQISGAGAQAAGNMTINNADGSTTSVAIDGVHNAVAVTETPDSNGNTTVTADTFTPNGSTLLSENIALGSGGNVNTTFNENGGYSVVSNGPNGTVTMQYDKDGDLLSATLNGPSPSPEPGPTPYGDPDVSDATNTDTTPGDDAGDYLAMNDNHHQGYYA